MPENEDRIRRLEEEIEWLRGQLADFKGRQVGAYSATRGRGSEVERLRKAVAWILDSGTDLYDLPFTDWRKPPPPVHIQMAVTLLVLQFARGVSRKEAIRLKNVEGVPLWEHYGYEDPEVMERVVRRAYQGRKKDGGQ